MRSTMLKKSACNNIHADTEEDIAQHISKYLHVVTPGRM